MARARATMRSALAPECRCGSASIRKAAAWPGCKAPFTEWPPMATLGRQRRRGARRAVRARRWPRELRAVGIIARLRAGARRAHQPDEPGHRRSRACRDAPRMVGALGARDHPGAAGGGRRRLRQALSRARRHEHDSHLELPLVEHPPERLRAVEFVPFRAAIEAGVAAIMTAHVLVPALDEERPATLRRRIVHGLLRDELGFDGVDPQRRSRDEGDRATATRSRGGGGGDRGRLRRRAALQRRPRRQAAALEALVRAVEAERAAARRGRGRAGAPAAGEGAVPRRLRRGAVRRAASPSRGGCVGCDEHRAIADEMAQHCVLHAEAARAAAGRPPRAWSRRPARSPRTSSTRASRSCGGSASSRSTTSASSTRDGYVAGAAQLRAAAIQDGWRDPSIAGADRGARRLRQRRSCCRCSTATRCARARKVFIGYSDLTVVLTFLTIGAAWSRSTARCVAGRLGARRGRLRSRVVSGRVCAGRAGWASWRRPALEVAAAPARRAGRCSAAR